MMQKNRYSTNSSINNPVHNSEFYISENDRLFGDNFATGEYLRRKQEIEKKKEKYKLKQNQLFERERKRWERLDYDYLKKENQSMMNKERNLVGRKNNPGMAFNPLNLQYDNSVQGEILKRRDEESKYRAWLRSINIDKHSNTGYNIINGEERKILEERLNKDIVPDLIQKNIDQINEMKNKVIFNYNNFYTRCNPSSPDLRDYSYRYDNNNNMNGNRINRSSNTPNVLNNNGGRYRAPVDLRDERMLYDNNVARSNNNIRPNNNFDNNYFDNNNMRNNFSPQPRSPREMYERNDMNMNMNNMNNNNINMNNNMNNNNYYNNNNDMNMNNNNNQYNVNNKMPTPNVGIIDLNNMDSNSMNPNMNQNDNNNTLNNNLRNMNNVNNMNNQNNRTNQTPNNFVQNGNNVMGNNANSNLAQNEMDINNYQPPPQSNYGVNPFNPYSRPACVY